MEPDDEYLLANNKQSICNELVQSPTNRSVPPMANLFNRNDDPVDNNELLTVANPNAIKDKQPPATLTSMNLEDNTPDSLSFILQEWNTFYEEFVKSPIY